MNMQYALKVFEYKNDRPFHIIDREGEPWFVLSDVCRELQINNSRQAATRLDEDEKDVITNDTLGGSQTMMIINESGLYSLILTSRKPEAKIFKKWVTKQVLPSIRKTGFYGTKTPMFIRRYNKNWDRVAQGHFSIMNELIIRLWGRFEHLGHIMADKAPCGIENRPDTSVGILFSRWLKKSHTEVADNYSLYLHWTEAKEVEARQYPMSMLPLFHQFLDTEWIPNRAQTYFNTRDPAALPHVANLLPSIANPQVINS